MTPQPNIESLANRFAPAIEGLQEFFASRGMRYGSPDDLFPLVERLSYPGPFRDEMASMLRATIYREGGQVSRVELLELIVLAIGGPNVEDASHEIHEPVGQLLTFVGEVIRSLRSPTSEAAHGADVGEEAPYAPGQELPYPTDTAADASVPVPPVYASGEVYLHAEPALPLEEDGIFAPMPPIPVPVVARSRLSRVTPEPPPQEDDLGPPAEIKVFHVPTEEAVAAVFLEGGGVEPAHVEPTYPDPGYMEPQYVEPAYVEAAYVEQGFDQADPGEPAIEQRELAGPGAGNPYLSPRDVAPKRRLPAAAFSSRLQQSYALPVLCAVGLALAAGLFLHHHVVVQTAQVARASLLAPSLPVPPRLPSSTIPMSTSAAAIPNSSAPLEADRPGTSPAPSSPPAASLGGDDLSKDETATAIAPARGAGGSTVLGATIPPQGGPVAGRQPEIRTNADSADASSNTHPARAPRATPAIRTYQVTSQGLFALSSGMMSGSVVSAPPPVYPKMARLTHVQGQVILQAVVGRNGTVIATHALRGHRLLRGAAMDAVRRWRYRPYTMDGKPTEVATIVTIDFRLPR